jgi:hypothetical protein
MAGINRNYKNEDLDRKGESMNVRLEGDAWGGCERR